MTTQKRRNKTFIFFSGAIISVILSFIFTNFADIKDLRDLEKEKILADYKPLIKDLTKDVSQLMLIGSKNNNNNNNNRNNNNRDVSIDFIFANQSHITIEQDISGSKSDYNYYVDLNKLILTSTENELSIDFTKIVNDEDYSKVDISITLPRRNWSIEKNDGDYEYRFINSTDKNLNNSDNSTNDINNDLNSNTNNNINNNEAEPIDVTIYSNNGIFMGNYNNLTLIQKTHCTEYRCFTLKDAKVNTLTAYSTVSIVQTAADIYHDFDYKRPFAIDFSKTVNINAIELYVPKNSAISSRNMTLLNKITWHDSAETQEDVLEAEKIPTTE